MSNEPASLSISEDMPDDYESGIYGKCLEKKLRKFVSKKIWKIHLLNLFNHRDV